MIKRLSACSSAMQLIPLDAWVDDKKARACPSAGHHEDSATCSVVAKHYACSAREVSRTTRLR